MTGRRAATPRILAGLLLALHTCLAWFGRAPGILTRQDDALYVILARSLLRGTYRDLHRIDAPLHALYPPAYPAELAVWGSVFGFGPDALVLLSILCSTLALALFWAAAARRFSPWLAVAALLPLAVNPLVLQYAGSVASEAPFLLASMAALWVASRTGRPGRNALLALAAAALLASLTRAAGVALLGGVTLYWLLERRRWAAAVFALASVCLIGGWLLWSGHSSSEGASRSYVGDAVQAADMAARPSANRGGPLQRLASRVPGHLWFYGTQGAPWAMAAPTIPGTIVDNVAVQAVIVGSGLVGLVLMLGRWRLAGLYLLVYSALLVVYPWYQPRFVTPVVPLALLAALAGAQWLGARAGRPRLQAAFPAFLALLIAIGGLTRSVPAVRDASRCDRSGAYPDPDCMLRDQASWFEAIAWVREHLPQDAVLLTMKPEPLFHYTGLRSVGVAGVANPPDSLFIPRLRDRGAEYILLGSLQSAEPRLSRRMLANCDALTVLAFFPERTWLFQVREPATAGEERATCEALARYRAANIDRDFGSDQ